VQLSPGRRSGGWSWNIFVHESMIFFLSAMRHICVGCV